MEVEAAPGGEPARIHLAGGWTNLSLARRPWRIDQHWWRSESSRTYYRVALADGPLLTLYQDLTTGCWFRQEY